MTQTTGFEPVRPDQRVELIDILRGFALTGVLLVNMMNYGGHWDKWTGSLDTAFHVVEVFFFEQRFWHLFSILFGLGFAIQLLRADAKGVKHLPVYLRRLAILFGFGAFSRILWGVEHSYRIRHPWPPPVAYPPMVAEQLARSRIACADRTCDPGSKPRAGARDQKE